MMPSRGMLRFADAVDSYEDSEFVVLGAPFDRTTTFRSGARFAPTTIREASSNFEKELFAHVSVLEQRGIKANDKTVEKAKAHIRDRLTQLAPVFLKNKYMLGDNFSMLDVAIAPLLWRLDHYGIELSKNAAPLLKYAERIFSRPAYIEALTPSEKVMRK